MTPQEFLQQQNDETSFRIRLARVFALYLPFGDTLSRLFISSEATKTPEKGTGSSVEESPEKGAGSSVKQTRDIKLSEAFFIREAQGFMRIIAPVFSGIAVSLGVGVAVALLTTNPIGWVILAGIAAGLLTAGAVYGITLGIQKLKNKWNSRVKIAETKNLTEEEAERLALKIGLLKNALTPKFKAIDRSEQILTATAIDDLCKDLPTPALQQKLRAELGLNAEEVIQLREKLDMKTNKSLFYLRWASGDSDPLANQAIVNPQYGFFSKRFTKEKIGAVIGSSLGLIIGCAGVFFGLPLAGFDLTLAAVPVQVAVLIGTAVMGAFVGRDVGADFNQQQQTTTEKDFAELEEKNHAGRWKIYRLMRNVIAAISYSAFMMSPKFLIHFGEKARELAFTFAYGVAGLISGGVRLNKKSAGPVSNPTIVFNKYGPDATKLDTEKNKELLKLFWLERYFKYKTKLDHARLSDSIAHGIFWNVRYTYEAFVKATWDPYYTKSKGLQKLGWLFQGIFFGPFAIAIGVAKSIIETVLILPVVNHVWSASKAFFAPHENTPAALKNWYAAPARFLYHLSPLPTYAKIIENDKPESFLHKAYIVLFKTPTLYLMDILSVGKNTYSDQRANYLGRYLEAEQMLKELAQGNTKDANDKRNIHLQTYVTKATERENHVPDKQRPADPNSKRLITRSWSQYFQGQGSEESKKQTRLLKTGAQDPREKVVRYADHYAPAPLAASPAATI